MQIIRKWQHCGESQFHVQICWSIRTLKINQEVSPCPIFLQTTYFKRSVKSSFLFWCIFVIIVLYTMTHWPRPRRPFKGLRTIFHVYSPQSWRICYYFQLKSECVICPCNFVISYLKCQCKCCLAKYLQKILIVKLWLVDGHAALPCWSRLTGTKVWSDLSCIKGSQLSSKSSSVCLQSQQDVQIRSCGEPFETISNRWFF